MIEIPLGKQTDYPEQYSPALLYRVNRSINRKLIGITDKLPFSGFDHWRAYELSWLDSRGMPVVKMADILVPCDSEFLIESKSMKLYFNSLNQHRFDSDEQAIHTIRNDLGQVAGAVVEIVLNDCVWSRDAQISSPQFTVLLDTLLIDNLVYDPACNLLEVDFASSVEEVFFCNLFRSRCPITAQPDWGSVIIRYHGPAIDHKSLLRYIISYRQHSGFHENCVEQIFTDICNVCSPAVLDVSINFLRRGGIEINPFRTLTAQSDMRVLPRFLRQ